MSLSNVVFLQSPALFKQESSVTPDLMQGVPDRLAGWEEEFVIPKQYSGSVMAALTTGRITSNVRAQITQDIATKMLSYCKYPSPEQYERVSQKLVETFPILKDSMGLGHVSSNYKIYMCIKGSCT